MLREIQARQLPGEPARRWFSSPDIDLYIWLGEDGAPTGFQLVVPPKMAEPTFQLRVVAPASGAKFNATTAAAADNAKRVFRDFICTDLQ